MTGDAQQYTLPEALLAWRRLRLTRVLGHDLTVPPPSGDLPSENRAFLLQQAEELYWEELSWERLTGDEEAIAMIIEDILIFLAGRWIVLEGDTDREHAIERDANLRLIDLVLYRLHGVDVHEAHRLELTWAEGDE